MPVVPVAAAGAVKGGLGLFGSMGASNAIALSGLTLATGAALASVQTNVVDISDIELTASPGTGLVVGDLVRLRATCTVSFGDIWSGGTGTAALIEYDRGGSRVLATEPFTQDARSARQVDVAVNVAGIQHERTTHYAVAVEVTGEDDVSGSLIDDEITRVRRSQAVALQFERPYTIIPVHSSPTEITHGEDDFFEAVAANQAQFPVSTVVQWISTSNFRGDLNEKRIPARSTSVSLSTANFQEEHRRSLHQERNPVQYFVALRVYEASMEINHPAPPGGVPIVASWTDSPRNVDVAPGHVTRCSVPVPTESSLLIPGGGGAPPGARAVGAQHRRFTFGLRGLTGDPIPFTGTVSDDNGTTTAITSSAGGVAEVDAWFTGSIGTLVARAADGNSLPMTIRFPFDRAETFLDARRFVPAPGPVVAGIVSSPGIGGVAGARVSLSTQPATSIVDTVGDGSFRIETTAADWSTTGPRLEVRLPRSTDVHWAREVITVELDRDALDRGERVVVTARRATGDAAKVTLSGRTVIRDEANRDTTAVGGVNIRLRSATGEPVADTRSGNDGCYVVSVPPGVYRMEVSPPRGLSVRPVPPVTVHVGADRPGVDVRLRLPRPQTLDLGQRLRVVAPTDGLHVALVAGDHIVDERPLAGSTIDVERVDLLSAGITAVAFIADGASSGLAPLVPASPDLTVGDTSGTDFDEPSSRSEDRGRNPARNLYTTAKPASNP
jgi:hypothetical protein